MTWLTFGLQLIFSFTGFMIFLVGTVFLHNSFFVDSPEYLFFQWISPYLDSFTDLGKFVTGGIVALIGMSIVLGSEWLTLKIENVLLKKKIKVLQDKVK